MVPAFPAGCWQTFELPLHWSAVQTLPSSVQLVPLGFFTSGQFDAVPLHVSATSHSPAAARQTTPALPAGCWQAFEVPLHWSVVHTLPSSAQLVPLVFLTSAGHAMLLPVHVSATSHSP